MEPITVTFSSTIGSTSELDFSVTINSADIQQIFLFGVDVFDFDGFVSNNPPHFQQFSIPPGTSDSEFSRNGFETCWQRLRSDDESKFTGVGQTVNGFKVTTPSLENPEINGINWFAYALKNGTAVERIEGMATYK